MIIHIIVIRAPAPPALTLCRILVRCCVYYYTMHISLYIDLYQYIYIMPQIGALPLMSIYIPHSKIPFIKSKIPS